MELAHEIFRWSKTYSVHIAVLDEQHRHLVETLNELHHALAAGHGNSVLDQVLQKLLNYAREHFATEERLMKQHTFPGLPTHRTQHQEFLDKIAEFEQARAAGKPGVPVSLLFFAEAWLKQHVRKTDQLYSGFLNARGVY